MADISLMSASSDGALDHLLPKSSNEDKALAPTDQDESVFVQLVDSDGSETATPIWLPLTMDTSGLTVLLNDLTKNDENSTTYDFFIGEVQILDDLKTALVQARAKRKKLEQPDFGPDGLEAIVKVVYQAQAIFRVRPVTRCSSTLPGHKGAVLVAQFSPDARNLATGSGDQTVRFWDLNTELPTTTGSNAHQAPVLCLSWSPNGLKLASGCQAGVTCLWKEDKLSNSWVLCSGKPLIRPQLAKATASNSKTRWIRSVVWRPLHLDPDCRKLAVAYQDSSIVIWDTITSSILLTITGHEKPVVCIRWGGTDLIYSASQDRTIRVWRSEDGVLCRTLNLHGHWVNCLALSTDYVLRTGAFDPAHLELVKPALTEGDTDQKQRQAQTAKELYEKVKGASAERLVAGSDDNTLSLWQPEVDKKPLAPRMTGHQGVVNDVKFSPNARLIASASFDHSVKIWDGFTGQFLATLYGHVQDVYLVAWSSDSRLLVSCSKDSTLKLWSLAEVRRWQQESVTVSQKERKRQIFAADVAGKKQKAPGTVHQRKRHILHDLPGHSDAVYALDWSPDGQFVASGGKDKVLKLWRA